MSSRAAWGHTGTGADRGLVEDGAAIGVDADSKKRREALASMFPELLGRLGSRHGVEVDDGVNEPSVGQVLQLHPLPQGADVVAQMRDSGGLDARKDDPRPEGFAGGKMHAGRVGFMENVFRRRSMAAGQPVQSQTALSDVDIHSAQYILGASTSEDQFGDSHKGHVFPNVLVLKYVSRR